MHISLFYVSFLSVQVFAINVKAQFLVAQQAYIHMEEKGRVILMSSITAQKVSSCFNEISVTCTAFLYP
jgi:NAD(P)-dependent dehydrogenase (short-subunit alcohol dehydrogenase family)